MTTVEIPRSLVRDWALCGIAAAAARFVPVPLLDDLVRDRATRLAVTRTLKVHGREPVGALEPLWEGAQQGGVVREAMRNVAKVPLKIAAFPVRKYVAIFGAVRGVPTDVMTVLLLGRAVHHALAAGRLAGPDGAALRGEAERIRRAYEEVLDGMDLRLLAGALTDVLSQGKELSGAAVGFARRRFGGREEDDAAAPDGAVRQGAERVEEVLRRPDVVRLLEEFDRRMDARLA